MKFKFNDNSLNKVLTGFDQASKKIVEDLYDELVVTGLMIESKYKLNVLVDTGRLKSSAWTKHKKNKSYNYSNALGETFSGALDYDLKDHEVVVGTNVNYAIYVEERWKNKAFENAYSSETKGLEQRLKKILK